MLGLLIFSAALAMADDFEISRSTVDAGGVMLGAGGEFELSGTIGQPDASVMTGGEFTLIGGFWFAEPCGDCNSSGGVDLLDYGDLEPCLMGPNVSTAEGCSCFDMDHSGAVDLLDFAVLQASFDGS